MKLLVAASGSLVLLFIAAFCLFGFLATFEPTSNTLVFRIGYTVVGLACLLGAGILIATASRKK